MKEIGTSCPNSKSICKKFTKDLRKFGEKFVKNLQKIVAKKSAQILQNATAHFAKFCTLDHVKSP